MRGGAARALGDMDTRSPRLLDSLASALVRDPDARVRSFAASALSTFGSKAVPALEEALSDTDSGVRMSAAYALGKAGRDAHSALPPLDAHNPRNTKGPRPLPHSRR